MEDIEQNNIKISKKSPNEGFLFILGISLIFAILYFFRDGVFNNGDFNSNYYFVYKIILYSVLSLSIISAIHVLILSWLIKNRSNKIYEKSNNETVRLECFDRTGKFVLNRIWTNYYSTFCKDDIFKNKTRVDADLYFNADEIANKSFFKLPVLEIMRALSGTFIGLGILGTFIGFSGALGDVSNNINEEILEGVFKGLKSAFNTSIVGVISSVIYTFLIANPLISKLERNSRELCDLLDYNFYLSDVDYMNRIIKDGRNEFAEKTRETMEALSIVTSVLKETPAVLVESNKILRQSVDTMCAKTKEQIDLTIETIRTSLTEELSKVSLSFNDFAAMIKKSSDSISKVPESIERIRSRIETEITDTGAAFACVATQLETKFETNIRNLVADEKKLILDELNVISKASIENISEQIGMYISDSMESLNTKISTSVDDSVLRVEDFTKTQVNEVKNVLETSITSLSTLTKSMNTYFDDFSIKLSDQIDSAVETISKVYDEVKEFPEEINTIYKQLKSIPEELSTITNEFIEGAKDLDKSISLTESIQSIKDLNNQLKEKDLQLMTLFNSSTEKFKDVINSITTTSDAMSNLKMEMESTGQKFETQRNSMKRDIDILLKESSRKNVLETKLDTIIQLFKHKTDKDE